mmetsp:Transcript_100502/g.199615  ORF Transcript_100502/g.199615 Transcript_100502/m.199615 type:complete len:206 (-) Transcript_100502:129-746(-)
MVLTASALFFLVYLACCDAVRQHFDVKSDASKDFLDEAIAAGDVNGDGVTPSKRGVKQNLTNCPDGSVTCTDGTTKTFGRCLKMASLSCDSCDSGAAVALMRACNASPCAHGREDGCSVPKSLSNLYNDVFDAACRIHDACYSTPGRAKDFCDTIFKHNMLASCNDKRKDVDIGGVTCSAAAEAFYLAVKELAQSSYEKDQKACR